LIETAFVEMRREPDVKVRADDLTYDRAGTDVTVYKMHGSVSNLGDVVLATDDFELYRIKREAFLRVLAGHLISTSFLFVGVSFTDPNVGHLLAGIREMFERYAPQGHGQAHYAILRIPQLSDFHGHENASAKAKTAAIRHQLFVEDLKRYNIYCVGVDRHEETEEILADVEQRIALRAVFISGGLADGALLPEQAAYVRAVARVVGGAVAASGKRLVSGYGPGIGDHVLSGMLGAGWLEASSNLDKRITVRPFPHGIRSGIDREAFNLRYREDLVALAGACVVVCGIRDKKGEAGYESARGVHEEVRIARALGRLIIPIGATLGAAQELWEEMAAHIDDLDSRVPRAEFATLGDKEAAPDAIGRALLTIPAGLRTVKHRTGKRAGSSRLPDSHGEHGRHRGCGPERSPRELREARRTADAAHDEPGPGGSMSVRSADPELFPWGDSAQSPLGLAGAGADHSLQQVRSTRDRRLVKNGTVLTSTLTKSRA
jgi:hypothetical protein